MPIIVITAYESIDKYPLIASAALRHGGVSYGMVEIPLEDKIGAAHQFVTELSFEAKADADAFIAGAVDGVQYSRA